jgi:hypothetical protein
MPSSSKRDDILQTALGLPEAERLILAHELLDSLPDDLPGLDDQDPDFTEELERRSGDWEGAVPWEQLRDELRRTL